MANTRRVQLAGELEEELLRHFLSGNPKLSKAKALLRKGADINAIFPRNIPENMLAQILTHYGEAKVTGGRPESLLDNAIQELAEMKQELGLGDSMLRILVFFLENGFEVAREHGRWGAQCLTALTEWSNDEAVIVAIKLLLDAGAKNVPPYLWTKDTPWMLWEGEQARKMLGENNYHAGNICEAVYQIFQAADDGESYEGIGSYLRAIGKKPVAVYTEKPKQGETIFYEFPESSKHKTGFHGILYFQFQFGVLLLTDFARIWTDFDWFAEEARSDEGLLDVSQQFTDVIGSRIEGISFGAEPEPREPVVEIKFSNGAKLLFSTNCEEAEKVTDITGYFYQILK